MMDSQENALEQTRKEEMPAGSTAEVENEETARDTGVAQDEETKEQEQKPRTYETKKEVVERLREIAHGEEVPAKEEVDALKSAFYKLHKSEREASLKEYLDAGGDPDKYQIVPDDYEEAFKSEMMLVKEKRSNFFLKQEEEKQDNLKRKQEIIEKIKTMATSPEEANRSYQQFKQLQQEWKEIKQVPAEKANELWRNYQLYVEQFYDLLKLNSEAREYDFKKNLEKKTQLCEAAEKLADEEDVISAFHQLQDLHQEYRETGPVAKELREELWARFKAASTVINKKHQKHYEELRAKEEENLNLKTALCEKVEEIAKRENNGAADWDRNTKEIIEIQGEWKTIGFAPQKMNVKIFERFRKACDDFFGRKSEYFKEMKQHMAENAEKKRALVEQAQAMQDSTDWKKTADKLIALQKEWKAIGVVPRKLGDKLWEDFISACNKFFEARNEATSGTRRAEKENFGKKREIIDKLKAMLETPEEDAKDKVYQLIDEYNSIGHVPFKEKDKLYEEYREVLDRVFKELNISANRRRLDNFRSSVRSMAERGEGTLDSERSRLMRRYEGLKQEIQTYENNLGFLNAASKKGSTLIDEMNRKVQKLKDECELVRQKIKTIDAENRDKE